MIDRMRAGAVCMAGTVDFVIPITSTTEVEHMNDAQAKITTRSGLLIKNIRKRRDDATSEYNAARQNLVSYEVQMNAALQRLDALLAELRREFISIKSAGCGQSPAGCPKNQPSTQKTRG
jgi:hypothetical protein